MLFKSYKRNVKNLLQLNKKFKSFFFCIKLTLKTKNKYSKAMKFIQQVFLNVSQVVKHEIKLAKKFS